VQPQLIEKDFYLTRILWALGQSLGDGLLLKGGTLLSKVDLGFFRMSEDADLVLPGPSSRQRLPNVRRMHKLRDVLKEVGPLAGVATRSPAGEFSDKATHCVWQLDYPSEFGPQGIRLEVSIRPVLRKTRKVRLQQLLADPLAGDATAAECLALDAAEARAEKVRAAFTREAARDFYDLDRLHESGADLSSSSFIDLVDAKLAELGAPPMAKQERFFGLSGERRRQVEAGLKGDLTAVLRADAPRFDLDRMLARFDRLWRK
jgi:predicted nucleotidyltransferase component of viral defense system